MILRTSPHSASRLLTSNSLLNSKLAYGLVIPQKWLTCDSAIALLVVYSKKAGTQRDICTSMFFKKKKLKKIFVWLCRGLSCGMGDLVPWPGLEPRSPVLGTRSLSPWTTREVPACPEFTAALFTVAKRWKQPKCPSVDEWMDILWCILQWNTRKPLKKRERERERETFWHTLFHGWILKTLCWVKWATHEITEISGAGS